ncbi:NAD-dependent succinate-semialdehyde dehydrogenase [Photobacterium nomapromontoriensis]|uniref:NAD-dependent succinate-semialdehyde dehydrogenase n=1 Tax=Photobacterium nomapromontoriensis TaxID=2910237 RepID=UPI003D1308E8
MFNVINPATGKLIQRYATLASEQTQQKIAYAQQGYLSWRECSLEQRASMLKRVAAQLRQDKTKLAQLMTDEMGKPVKEAGAEVDKAAWCCDHYAEHAATYLQDDVINSDASQSYVHYQPIGALLGVLPWNAPLWIAFRFLAPALMAGNSCVMKHDPHVPGCAEAIEQVFRDAGAPEGLVVNLPIANEDVADAIRHPHIQAVSFTGSAQAGGIVAATAAAEIKHAVLELGGSDPFIVLEDADQDAAADIAVLSRIINAGQSCIAAKRILVEQSIYDEFVGRLKQRLEMLIVGDPNDPVTDVGPIAREDLRANLHRQVMGSIAQGANCLLGGELPEGDGYFYPVTLLTDAHADMCAMQEEVFGPVMVVCPVRDTDEALQVANASEYGLGAGVWSCDSAKALALAERLETGQVAINGIVKTDPRLPSGGIKKSGFGRELGEQGIKAFINAKQIWIK